MNCITGGEAKRNRRSRNSLISTIHSQLSITMLPLTGTGLKSKKQK
ncbi:MAG: hypothetical protein LBE12_03655 [Planctomycetaceae bacterium]|nr:hypothetical protein [Planctomycetaceae bacterium]